MSVLFIQGGDLIVHENARAIPVMSDVLREYANSKFRADYLWYVYYCCYKGDTNPYWGMPERERKREILRMQRLLGCTMQSSDSVCDRIALETEKLPVGELMRWWSKMQLSDSERVVERMRDKVSILTEQYMVEGDFEIQQKIYKSLDQAKKLLEQEQLKTMNEEQQVVCEYLFEIPEQYKPYHLKIT